MKLKIHLILVPAIIFRISKTILGQKDSSRFQIELAGIGFKLRGASYLYFNLGVNTPAKKKGWYNSLAFSVNIRDNTRSSGALRHFSSLSVGKHYQLTKNHFFCSAGFGTGIYYVDYTYSLFYNFHSSKHFGILLTPRLEAGLSFKRIVLSAGVYYGIGGGPFSRSVNGSSTPYRLGWHQRASPYLKIIIK